MLKMKYEPREISALFTDELVSTICATTAFQRLKDISFLGAIDSSITKTNRQNRFDHSVGVALLASHCALKANFSKSEARHTILAALLHDVGHAPLSHSLEPLFTQQFGLNHHIATEQLLKGEKALGVELSEILRSQSIDIDYLVSLMAGNENSLAGQLFSSPINIDTIEAIWRAGVYVGKSFRSPIDTVDALLSKNLDDISILDEFWESKDYIYQSLIYSSKGIEADYVARFNVENSSVRLNEEEFFSTEKSFSQKDTLFRTKKC